MAMFLQQLVTGLSIGSVYALLAVGYALIYSIFDFTNFAFGNFIGEFSVVRCGGVGYGCYCGGLCAG